MSAADASTYPRRSFQVTLADRRPRYTPRTRHDLDEIHVDNIDNRTQRRFHDAARGPEKLRRARSSSNTFRFQEGNRNGRRVCSVVLLSDFASL